MELRIDVHTQERASERGASSEEMRDVLATGLRVPAKYGRLAKEKVFRYGKERLGKLYPEKKIRLVYTIGDDIAVAVTVYVYYGQWEA